MGAAYAYPIKIIPLKFSRGMMNTLCSVHFYYTTLRFRCWIFEKSK